MEREVALDDESRPANKTAAHNDKKHRKGKERKEIGDGLTDQIRICGAKVRVESLFKITADSVTATIAAGGDNIFF